MNVVAQAAIDLALVCLVFVPLERIAPRRDIPLIARARATDWLHATLTPWIVAGIVLGASRVPVHGPVRLHALVATLPRPVAFVLAFLVAELGTYGVHYAMHRIPFLWRFHAVHHSAEQLDFLAGMRRHPVDTALSALALALPGFLLGLPLGDVAAYALFAKLWTIFLHANIDVRLRPLERIVTTPYFHHGHHDHEETEPRNLATLLAALDVLFGTYRAPAAWPRAYGTTEPVSRSWLGQLALRRR